MNRFTIGRGTHNDIVLAEATVSSNHAELIINDRGVPQLRDNNSKNGTFVNNVKISGIITLRPGDRVRFGKENWDWESFLTGGFRPSQNINRQQPHSMPVMQSTGSSSKMIWIGGAAGLFVITILALFVFTSAGKTMFKKVFGSDTAQNGYTAKRKITYDISCLRDSTPSDQMIGLGDEMRNEMIKKADPVPIEDEVKVGDEVYESIRKDVQFLSSGPYVNRVRTILNKLIPLIDSPRGFKYKYYVINSKEINAFTAGGKIFVYTGIMDFAKNEDELACVLGHEIYHNELGHINQKLKAQKFMQKLFGNEGAVIAQMADALFGQAFNQDEETLSDLHGLDLAIKAGYKGCAIIDLWERMAQKENQNEIEKWFRSHPYGKQRSGCIRHHIKSNYDVDCK